MTLTVAITTVPWSNFFWKMNFSWWDEAEQLHPTDESSAARRQSSAVQTECVVCTSAWLNIFRTGQMTPMFACMWERACLSVGIFTHGGFILERKILSSCLGFCLLTKLLKRHANNDSSVIGQRRQVPKPLQVWSKNLWWNGEWWPGNQMLSRNKNYVLFARLLRRVCVCVCFQGKERGREWEKLEILFQEVALSYLVVLLYANCSSQERKSNVWPLWGKQEAFYRVRDLISILLFSKGR